MKTGEGLATDLRQLLIVATVKLPLVAEVYANTAAAVNDAQASESEALGPPGPGGALHGSELKTLSALLYKALWANGNNILETGSALEKVAWDYADSDGENASDILKDKMKEYESWGDTVDQPPDDVTLPPAPYDL